MFSRLISLVLVICKMSQVTEESGVQLKARFSSECRPNIYSLDPVLFPNNGPNRKEIAEISGDTGVGKTALLMHIMGKVILPFEYGGKDAMVVFLLTEHKFDMAKFKSVLKSIINNFTLIEMNVDTIITESLQNITILRCFDEEQFDLTIYGLDDILYNNRFCLLALDSIGAFCWSAYKKSYMNEILKRLNRVVDEHQIVLVYTKPAYFLFKNKINERNDRVNYVMELICKDEEAMEECLVYKLDITKCNQNQSICRSYDFDSSGVIVFNE